MATSLRNPTKTAYLAVTIILAVLMIPVSVEMGSGSGLILSRFSVVWTLILLFEIILPVFAVTCQLIDIYPLHEGPWLARKIHLLHVPHIIGVIGALLLILGMGWLVFYFQPDRFHSPIALLWLLWFVSFISAFLTKRLFQNMSLLKLHILLLLLAGDLFLILNRFQEVTDYPFSLGWSEGSRYFNASLFFSNKVYGQESPLPVLHPSRYLLQSLPFLSPSPSLWLLRFWQFLLWTSIPIWFAWLLVHRLNISDVFNKLALLLLIPLVLNIGPVYYHLLFCAIPILAFYRNNNKWMVLVIVICASIWAGISRINWWPLPGAMTTLLFINEEIVQTNGKPSANSFIKYFRWPFVWLFSGTITGYISNILYETISRNPPYLFNSSLSSPLLWYRLLPNSTSQLGILIQSLLIFSPFVLFVGWIVKKNSPFRFYQGLGITALFGIFFLGGTIVSLKIGGGSNLHNYDAFIVLLLVSFSYAVEGYWSRSTSNPDTIPALLGLTLVIPLIPLSFGFIHYEYPPQATTSQTIKEIQSIVDNNSNGNKILFLSEIQLSTFKYLDVEDVELAYEKVFLQEMAMSDNKDFFEEFWTKIANREYPIIISERLSEGIQGPSRAFWEENNAWVTHVSRVVLRHYRLIDCFPKNNTCVYVPR